MSVKLVIGCGYLGMRVARAWLAHGDTVYATTRSSARADEWRASGIRPLVADVTDRASLASLPSADTVLFAVGYDRAAGKPIRDVYVQGFQHVLDQLPATTGRVIYISSTGVYGTCAGDWVDETTECRPLREGGQACLAAEQLLATHPLGARSVVLRLAGIYGPGRIPRVAALQAGEPIDAPAEGYLNLIHVKDAVEIVRAAERLTTLPELVVVSDGSPVVRSEYYAELARLVGAPPPRFVAPAADSPAAARASSDKRISNLRMQQRLNVLLHYPSYRTGLRAIVAGEA